MEKISVPDFMLSDTAAALAFLVLITSALSVLALALVDMKPEKLAEAFRDGVHALRKQEVDLEAGVVEPEEKKSRKKKGRRPRGRFSKILYFLLPDESVDEGAGDSPPYSLDDAAWLAPENALSEASMGEAFELSDAIWKSPMIAV